MGSGGGGSSRTVTTQELAPEQRALLEPVIPIAQSFLQQPPQQFPQSGIAGFDPLQSFGQEQLLQSAFGPFSQFAQGATQGAGTLTGAGLPIGTAGATSLIQGLGPAQNAAGFLLDPNTLSPQFNPFTMQRAQSAIRPLAESLTRDVLPGIRHDAIQQGGLGGSRQGIAEGLALQGFQNAAGDVSSNIFNQAFQSQLDAMTRALGTTQQGAAQGTGALLEQGTRGLFATPQLSQLLLQPGQIAEAVGAQRRGLSQGLLSEQEQRFITEQMLPFLIAQDVAGLAFGFPGGSTISRASGGGTSPLQGILGGAAGGAGLGGAIGGTVAGMGAGPFGAIAGGGLGLLMSLFS